MTLAEPTLKKIEAEIDAATTPIDALIAALRHTFVALGAPDISGPDPCKVDGRDYPLDPEQWRRVCQRLIARAATLDPIGRVNLGLDWMNYGPSAS